jgi:sulfide:quinone oxidoreductase
MPIPPLPAQPRVVIAGAGVAALEALLALRVLAGSRPDICLLAPDSSFLYRPVSVAEAFDAGEAREFELAPILTDQGATRSVGRLVAVDPQERVAHTSTGTRLTYDELVVAVGAHPEPAIPGAHTFRGRGDVAGLRATLDDLANERIASVAFVVPAHTAWTLPAYELALLTAAFASARNLYARVIVVSPEEDPLELFGSHASEAIAELLAARRIELHLLARAARVDGRVLRLEGGGALQADRVVALPRLAGPNIAGLPNDAEGFIPIDAHGRVRGLDGVYAAGDGSAFPLKQGGLAAQQADAVAEVIAQRAGEPLTPRPFSPVLRGLLLTGGVPVYLRAGPGALRREPTTANERGPDQPWPRARHRAPSSSSTRALWWPPGKIAGRYLAPYLATARPRPLAHAPLLDSFTVRDAQALEGEQADALELTLLLAEYDARWGDFELALRTLDAAEDLAGQLPDAYLDRRREWRRELAREPRDPAAA